MRYQVFTKIIIGISCFFLAGCTIYQPHPVDIPLINKKKQLKVDGGISLIPSVNGTVSYGLTDKYALQVHGYVGASEESYFQGAAGYYKNFKSNTVLEVYTGVGMGYGEEYDNTDPDDELKGDYTVYFSQINFGQVNNKVGHMDYGVGLKTGWLNSRLEEDYDTIEGTSISFYKIGGILLEPTAFMRVGGERLKFNLKVNGCRFFEIKNSGRKSLSTFPLNVGLSLHYTFGG